jgi:hypothetical protein
MPVEKSDDTDFPPFREWANDEDNAVALQMLVGHFLADEGVEFVDELIGCRGQQHQWVAEHWIGRLAKQYEQWRAQGSPTLEPGPKVRVSYHMPMMEYDAQRYLEANLPPGAVFGITRRWQKKIGGTAVLVGWTCTIEDGAASAMGQGAAPGAAARQALEAWREFVTSSRFELDPATITAAENALSDRPPLQDAPSTAPAEGEKGQDKKAV